VAFAPSRPNTTLIMTWPGTLHGLIELAEMTGRSGRTGKTDLS